ncbi:N-acetylglucosamine kinase [Microbacterium sp. A94]|uniref:N-acetylglucosamine kinase n=1 Tax=Microbacterium sp. A94 TaxID=3450717 RepID=UPI003F43A3E6
MSDLVLGGDLGGSTTRIVIADAVGAVRGEGTARGGNPVSQPETAHLAFAAALRAALGDVDPARIRGGVIGMAGSAALREQPARRAGFDAAWAQCGLTGVPRIVSDLEAAYASATDRDTGVVLIAGTGASAALIDGWQVVERRGGYGWLLGDEGAGVWLGRAAVRATLAALQEGRISTLASLVIDQFGLTTRPGVQQSAEAWPGEAQASALIRIVNDSGPLALAELAPLITLACAEGSSDAAEIVDEAARHLVRTVCGLLSRAQDGPVVLAGSILEESLPTGRAVRELLTPEYGDRLRFAASGTQGALALARREQR